MEEITRPRGPLRPTLIIAMDAFGIRVQELLLTDLAGRGLLEPIVPANSALGERYLYNLALIRLGDPPSGNAGDYEMMRDILGEIRCLSPSLPDLAKRLGSQVERAKQRLLDQATRQKYGDFSPPGLDIIVLAHPASIDEVGRLRELLDSILATSTHFGGIKAVDAAQAIRTVVILDFDNFQHCGNDLRDAIARNLGNWQDWRSRGARSVGRVYLLNGHSGGLRKEPRLREAETSAFLELMLYEGAHDETIRMAFHPAQGAEGILATFGIQVLERGAGIAVQFACAYYAWHWLDYLLSDAPEAEPETRHTRTLLQDFDTAEFGPMANPEEFDALSERAIAECREILADNSPQHEGHPDTILSRFESVQKRLGAEIENRVAGKRALLRRQELAEFGKKLFDAISRDLDGEYRPLPLGAVSRELKTIIERLEEETLDDASLPDAGSLFSSLRRHVDKLKETLSRQRRTQIDEKRFRNWWWVYALLLALAIAPVMQELIARTDTAQLILSLKPYYPLDVLVSMLNDIGWGEAWPHWIWVLLTTGTLGFFYLHGQIRRRLQRRERLFWSKAQGRLGALFRHQIAQDGALEATLRGEARRAVRDLRISLAGDISLEIERATAKLTARQQELKWLRNQFQMYLRTAGIDPMQGSRLREDIFGQHILRRITHGPETFRMLVARHNPQTPGNRQDDQANRILAPFSDWHEPFPDRMLRPREVLDRLQKTRHFEDPLESEMGSVGDGKLANQWQADLARFAAVQGLVPCFHWEGEAGGREKRYALFPSRWRDAPQVAQALHGAGIGGGESKEISSSQDQAYLLVLRTGVGADTLRDSA
uniref:Uncharacterized protein n=1 Tax=Candidatus Kentrum sp. DK TaxID=2126562 RepID=A0A450SCC4_9GAMM|nr:MAG: hypothetical protein BECKDK2373C_GA0170839_102719 [Candidatus Kentron sp. DK]